MQLWISFLLLLFVSEGNFYKTFKGEVRFSSETNQEKIQAVSNELKGVINAKDNTFRFTVSMSTFKGFNSALQKEHFLENYVEDELYPKAQFSGKIIEDINYKIPGTYQVRAKGTFELHGVSQHKIIPAKIIVSNQDKLRITTQFILNLHEYKIKVPKLVHKKVAENIYISVDVTLQKS